MARTVYYTATTLDGFLADEHDSLAWLFRQDIDQEGPANYGDFIAAVGALIMGATTYTWVLDHLAESGEPWPYRQPTWVLSHRDLPARPGVHVIRADDDASLRAVHATAHEAAGGLDVWAVGGGGVAFALARLGLLDEVRVQVAPVTLGAGKPLLAGALDLRLTDVGRNRDFACLTYEVVGPLREA